jgi:hypothetical protein
MKVIRDYKENYRDQDCEIGTMPGFSFVCCHG